MRPPKKIILSDEIKVLLRKKNKAPFLAGITGKRKNDVLYMETLTMVPYVCCPKGRKPFKNIPDLVGTIHTHIDQKPIEKNKLLANKTHIIITSKNKSAWYKNKNYLIEVKI